MRLDLTLREVNELKWAMDMKIRNTVYSMEHREYTDKEREKMEKNLSLNLATFEKLQKFLEQDVKVEMLISQ